MSDFDRGDFQGHYDMYSSAMAEQGTSTVFRSQAYNNTGARTFSGSIPNGSIKSEYNFGDYSYYRPSEADPRSVEEEIEMCLIAHRRYPIVSNIIDLMSDFGSQGVRIICADKRQEKFGQEWAKFVELQEFSARFLSTLYRCGTTIVKRTDGKVPLKTQKKWQSAVAGLENRSNIYNPTMRNSIKTPPGQDPAGSDIKIEDMDVKRAVMPLKWTIYNPLQVIMIGGMLGQFVGKPIFGLRINTQIRNEINQLPKIAQTHEEYQTYLNIIPKYVFDAVNNNSLYFPLDQSKIYAYYYKKDDWDVWGKTIIGPILRDLKYYDKVRLAESSALDGAITAVRLWKMGDLKEGVIPQKGALDKLSNMLANGVGGGTMDLVWGPDLDFKESSSNLYEFLKPEKYTQVISNIHAGLGIPSGLTGGAADSSTGAFAGLKTLVERLKYGRNVLVKFLDEQLKLVQEAMGFTKPFRVVFDQLMMSDEAAEKNVLLQMYDRNLISAETLRYAIDIDYSDIEEAKIRREYGKQGKSMPPKSSPFHNPEKEHEMNKIFAQRGGQAPSEFGLNLKPRKEGEVSPNEQMSVLKVKENKTKPKGSGLSGRPQNAADKNKRKKRRVMPKGVSANYQELFLYAEHSKSKIDEIVTPLYLSMASKKNIRSLTVEETSALEGIKFNILSSLNPLTEVNEETIASINTTSPLGEEIYKRVLVLENNHCERYGRKPTIAEKRKLDCEAYADIYSRGKMGFFCPECRGREISRQRTSPGIPSMCECVNGHDYKASDAIYEEMDELDEIEDEMDNE